MRVIILRHGETTSNAEKRIQGHLDTNLNARGEEQAEEVARYLRKTEKIDVIYSSSLKRAFRTAEIVAGDDLQVIPVDGFKERSMGVIEGMLHSEAIKKRNADHLPSLLSYGEDSQSLTRRVAKAYEDTVAESERKGYKTIVIVSHGSALYHLFDYLRHRPGMKYASKDVKSQVHKQKKLGNCCVTIIDNNTFEVYAEQYTVSIERERDLV